MVFNGVVERGDGGRVLYLAITQIMVLQAMALESESPMPGLNPLEAKVQLSDQNSDKFVDQTVAESRGPSSQEEGESKAEAAEAPDIRRLGKHHPTDKSVAGGGVILGGLVTVTFAAVFCYIRVTRKRDSDLSKVVVNMTDVHFNFSKGRKSKRMASPTLRECKHLPKRMREEKKETIGKDIR
ncbi:hypothetical protein CR513_25786, partial [Mucuna pruriens]